MYGFRVALTLYTDQRLPESVQCVSKYDTTITTASVYIRSMLDWVGYYTLNVSRQRSKGYGREPRFPKETQRVSKQDSDVNYLARPYTNMHA